MLERFERRAAWRQDARLRRLSRAARPAVAPAVSPLAPKAFPELPVIGGASFATCAAGVKYQGRDDVMLARVSPGSVIAGVFTTSSTRSAPVLDCERKMGSPATEGAAILVNSGNANAFTGSAGSETVAVVTAAVSETLKLPQDRIFTSSTGVIGEPLPHEKITSCIGALHASLDPRGLPAAARAIMTTDTYPKAASATAQIGETEVKVAGIAKGSGMIAPHMATMLVYIFSDVAITQTALQTLVSRINARSFNAITVDGDTSTSDTLLCAATGKAGNAQITDPDSPEAAYFDTALESVMHDLALQVVRDGEGATKLIEVRVTQAASDADAWKVAQSIANSPLVKTAIAGEDPNWGRIVMAVGKSGAAADRDRLSISFGDILVAENGWVASSYSEEAGATYMQQPEITVAVEMGLGDGRATMWTCDLTKRYIEINADYRS
ncbi:bifunctional glutamate N-acetyltransferase/amino-acid acetyltransferase ArgJ [Tropicimonas sp. S265A]|uniref:bifunctional glutamate N-acetyltransferase/amino-acid acetyltransferase ArgJ n=1 Tax=Tropicimonas sp. S265A TaxID=3415134 RepID=UPI003C7CB9DE